METEAESSRDLKKVHQSSSDVPGGRFGGGGGGAQRERRSGRSNLSGGGAGFDSPSLKLERVSHSRIYYPGQSYDTDDLAPREMFDTEIHSITQKTRRAPMRGKAIDKQLLETLDFRNARLLSQFVSETGKILPKRKTGLSAKVHRKMVKQVKVSRVMGIMPFTERLPQFTKRRN